MVVAFGPGIDLVRGDSPNRTAVDSLIAQGVKFDVCLNTIESIERETGQRPEAQRAAPAGLCNVSAAVIFADERPQGRGRTPRDLGGRPVLTLANHQRRQLVL